MADIEHRYLRSALEFAVLIAAEGQKRRPPLASPKELKPFFNQARLSNSALGKVRRAIEDDPVFRQQLAAGALPELVDEVGRLWLERPSGWEATASELIARLDDESVADDWQAQLRRTDKRREAAEQAAARTRTELLQRDENIARQRADIDQLRSELAAAQQAAQVLQAEVGELRMEARHARDRELAARHKAEESEAQLVHVRRQITSGAAVTADALVDVADIEHQASVAERRRLAAELAVTASAARQLADRLDQLTASESETVGDSGDGGDSDGAQQVTGRRRRRDRAKRSGAKRAPLGLPGGVIGSSAQAAEFFARSNALLLVDGYNVAKLGWPGRSLEKQRAVLLDAVDNLARRFGTDITVVFDGASVVGAHADRRRLVRVVFSPEGVIADDVIRDEVGRLPVDQSVVVVTNDTEIQNDVRAAGANVLPSNALIAIL